MELELHKQKFPCYQAHKEISEVHEQSAETIVPDYCPDMARIVDSSANVFLRDQNCMDGRISVNGAVQINILYMAEAGAGLKKLEFSLPVSQMLDTRFNEEYSHLKTTASIASLEVRAINPRKVATRVVLNYVLNAFYKAECSICSGIENQAEYGIETMVETKPVSLITALCEKDFIFQEEIILSGAKEPVAEILRSKQTLQLNECKPLGSKIMLKGTACIEALYLSEQGSIQQLCSELPFSQILDVSEPHSAQPTADVALQLCGAEYTVDRENGGCRVIGVKLYMKAFAILYETHTLSCISDLYSTSHTLELKTEETEYSAAPVRIAHDQPMREQLETGADVSAILSSAVSFSEGKPFSDQNRTSVRSNMTVKTLYIDESGAPYCVERRKEFLCELPGVSAPALHRMEAQQITAMPTAKGIDLRFSVHIELESKSVSKTSCLSYVSAAEDDATGARMPSLVLRRLQPKEKLWHLAKEYRTTIHDILCANDCTEEGELRPGNMLLIPKKRC